MLYIYIYIPFKINLLEMYVYIFATYADYLDTYVAPICVYIYIYLLNIFWHCGFTFHLIKNFKCHRIGL